MLQILRTIQFSFKANNLFLIRICKKNYLQCQITNFNIYGQSGLESELEKKKKKTAIIDKITLIHPNKSITVNFLEDAEKLAKRRNLKLVLVSETSKSGRSVYELTKEFEIDDNDEVNTNKSHLQPVRNTKMCIIQSKITSHDLNTKIKNINNNLKKNHPVKIQIYYQNDGDQNEICKTLKDKIQGNMTEERAKKGSIILKYSPSLSNNSISEKDDTSST